MKDQNPNVKLLTVSLINTFSTVCIWQLIQNDQSASLGYFFMLIILWIAFLIITGIIVSREKIKYKYWNLLIFIFCTPIPFLVFFASTSEENAIGSEEYNKNSHRIKKVEYANRKEYFTSVDLVTKENPFPMTENYHLDSIVYSDGNKTKYFK